MGNHPPSPNPVGSAPTRPDLPPAAEGDDLEPSASHRRERLHCLILDELNAIVRDESRDPALEDVHFVSVELSPDFRHARIGYIVEAQADVPGRDQERRAARALERATGFLVHRLREGVHLRRMPALRFVCHGAAVTDEATPDAGNAG